MASPLENRLTAKIAETTEETARGIYAAELACYWARTGDFERAETYRVELRKVFGDGRDLRVSVLIMILEALLLYFKDLSPAARDRLLRAQLLCSAGKERRLIALTSAWLAHIDFNLDQFERMSTALATCLDSLDADDGTAECRVSLVLGDAFMHSEEETAAKSWYERARNSATRLGDQAAIGAMTYNRAALRVSNLRIGQLLDQRQSFDISLAKSEVKSATNYQAVAGLRSLDHLIKAAQVGIFMLELDYANALLHIEQILKSKEVPKHSGAFYTLQADRVTCLVKLGKIQLAQISSDELTEISLNSLNPDDRALCFSALMELKQALMDKQTLITYNTQKQSALTQFIELRRSLRASIEKYA